MLHRTGIITTITLMNIVIIMDPAMAIIAIITITDDSDVILRHARGSSLI